MTLELTDQNFEEEIRKTDKPVLVDFWAPWCQPCFLFAPILEKMAEDYKDKLILAKVNLDQAPNTAQKYQVDRIPMVVLFKDGKAVGGFTGVRPESAVKEILNQMLEDSKKEENKKDIEEGMIKSYREYAEKNGFRLNPNWEVVERLIKGLLENEKKYGQKYCPCRRVSENSEEDKPKICPCFWHRQEIEKDGHCFCGLFVKR